MISRDLLRAVLESRDNRHDETHGALVMLFQALVAELVAADRLQAAPLAERLDAAAETVSPEPHGDNARDLLAQVARWLREAGGASPMPRWEARRPAAPEIG